MISNVVEGLFLYIGGIHVRFSTCFLAIICNPNHVLQAIAGHPIIFRHFKGRPCISSMPDSPDPCLQSDPPDYARARFRMHWENAMRVDCPSGEQLELDSALLEIKLAVEQAAQLHTQCHRAAHSMRTLTMHV
jgi:hypothetical protein